MKDLIEDLRKQYANGREYKYDMDSTGDEGAQVTLNEAGEILDFMQVVSVAITTQAKETARKVFIGIRVVNGDGKPSREQQDEYADANWQRFLTDPAKTILQLLGKL